MISKFFNYDNIGGKIKNIAKWYCWITILLIWISAPILFIVLVASPGTDEMWWIPIVGAIVGPFVIWVSTWPVYAFGEFVEDTHEIRNKGLQGEIQEVKVPTEKERNAVNEQLRPLSKQDIEKAVSAYLNKRVFVSEIECTLVYVIPASKGKPQEMHLSMVVGDKEFSSLDLCFFNPQKKGYYHKGKRLALDAAWLPANKIFSFDISEFASFTTEEDNSD